MNLRRRTAHIEQCIRRRTTHFLSSPGASLVSLREYLVISTNISHTQAQIERFRCVSWLPEAHDKRPQACRAARSSANIGRRRVATRGSGRKGLDLRLDARSKQRRSWALRLVGCKQIPVRLLLSVFCIAGRFCHLALLARTGLTLLSTVYGTLRTQGVAFDDWSFGEIARLSSGPWL